MASSPSVTVEAPTVPVMGSQAKGASYILRPTSERTPNTASQAFPSPSLSTSAGLALLLKAQLSEQSNTPSPSVSLVPSQAARTTEGATRSAPATNNIWNRTASLAFIGPPWERQHNSRVCLDSNLRAVTAQGCERGENLRTHETVVRPFWRHDCAPNPLIQLPSLPTAAGVAETAQGVTESTLGAPESAQGVAGTAQIFAATDEAAPFQDSSRKETSESSCGSTLALFSKRSTPRGQTSAHIPHPTQEARVKLNPACA